MLSAVKASASALANHARPDAPPVIITAPDRWQIATSVAPDLELKSFVAFVLDQSLIVSHVDSCLEIARFFRCFEVRFQNSVICATKPLSKPRAHEGAVLALVLASQSDVSGNCRPPATPC